MKALKKRMFSFIVFFSITIILALLIFMIRLNFFESKNSISLEAEIHNEIESRVKHLNRVVASIQEIPQDLAYALEFSDITDDRLVELNVDAQEYMRVILKASLFNNSEIFGGAIAFEPYQFSKDSLYFSFYLYKSGSELILTALNSPEYDYFNQNWYKLPKLALKPLWSEPYFDEGGGNIMMVTYSVPFYSYDGSEEKFNGIVTADVSVKELAKIIDYSGPVMGSHPILISKKGMIFYSKSQEWIFEKTIYNLAEEMNLPDLAVVGKELLKGNSGYKMIGKLKGEENWWAFYSSISKTGWGLLYLFKESSIYIKDK